MQDQMAITMKTQRNKTIAPARRPWPLRPQDATPLAWWRWLPSHKLRDAEALLIDAALDRIVVLRTGKDLRAALQGDAAAAIGAAFSLLPIEELTLEADIAMTALLRCALNGNPASALALANILGRTALTHPFATELAASWHSRISPYRVRFSVEEAALTEAIYEYFAAAEEGSSA
jgi:hypothetical protein